MEPAHLSTGKGVPACGSACWSTRVATGPGGAGGGITLRCCSACRGWGRPAARGAWQWSRDELRCLDQSALCWLQKQVPVLPQAPCAPAALPW